MNSKELLKRHEEQQNPKDIDIIIKEMKKVEKELKNGHKETYYEVEETNITKKLKEESTTLKIDEILDLRDKLEV